MKKKVILVWFRNDLRTTDNEVLLTAVQKSDYIIPVFIFDPRYYETNKFGFKNTGENRHQFIINAVYSLKQQMKALGGDLLTYSGYPEEILPQLVLKYDVDEVYHHREVAVRETSISEFVEEALWKTKRNLKHFIGHTLYHKEDLPFPIKDIPDDFNTFKKKVLKESFVRPVFPAISQIAIPPHVEQTVFPFPIPDSADCHAYGEQEAIAQLGKTIAKSEKNFDLYSEISPFLALGIISPAYTYHFLNAHINSSNKKGIQAILDRLMMRDYYRFMLKKHPNIYFISNQEQVSNAQLIESWTTANTENNYVNELLSKLNEKGNLTYREREIVALYFIYILQQPWLVGAAWFEQQLIDYAPASNYGFWAHLANQGTSVKNNKSQDDLDKYKELISVVE